MTAAEMAALRTLATKLDVGVQLAEFPQHVIDGLLDQGLAVTDGDHLTITLDGVVEAL